MKPKVLQHYLLLFIGVFFWGAGLKAQTVTILGIDPTGPFCGGSTIQVSFSAQGGPTGGTNKIVFQLIEDGSTTSSQNRTLDPVVDDGTTKTFNFIIPNTIKTGTYTLKALYRNSANQNLANNTLASTFVIDEKASAGTINTTSQTICLGSETTINNLTPATCPSKEVQYQWEVSTTSASTGFDNIPNANSADLNTIPLSTVWYRRKASCGNGCTSTTSSVKVTIAVVSAGTLNPDFITCGNPGLLHKTAATGSPSGGTLSYQWQQSTNNTNFTNVPEVGTTASTTGTGVNYNPAAITETTYYHRQVTYTINGTTCPAITYPITVYYNAPPSRGSISGTQAICSGGDPLAFTSSNNASGGSGTLSYQWELNDGSGWNIIDGAVDPTYDAPAGLTTETQYRRKAISTLTIADSPVIPVSCTSAATTAVTVSIKTDNVSAGTVTASSPLCIGASATFTSNGTSGGTWSSSNKDIASVDNDGKVTAVAAGSASISYSVTSECGTTVSASADIIVTPNVSAGTVTGSSSLCIGTSTTFTSNGTSGGTWSSSNKDIASVDNDGKVTAVAAGSASISYSVSSGCGSPVSASANVTISPNVSAGTVTAVSPLCVGTSATFTSNGTSGGTWSSSNENIATVANDGKVTAIAAGSASISYSISSGCDSPVSASAEITVAMSPAPQQVTANKTTGCPGETITLSANCGAHTAHWYSSTPNSQPSLVGIGATYTLHITREMPTYWVSCVSSLGCESTQVSAPAIVVKSSPSPFSITGGGYLGCNNVSAILTSGSELNTLYQLYYNSLGTSQQVNGNGGVLSFGIPSFGGTYRVIAKHKTSGCITESSGEVVYYNVSKPSKFQVTGGGSLCGSGSVTLGLSSSQVGVNYQLKRNGGLFSVLAGTGQKLSFGSTLETGTYTVEGTSSSGCVLTMQNGVLVTNFPCGVRTGAEDLDKSSTDGWVSVLDNPVVSILSVRFNKSMNGEVSLVIVGLRGEVLHRKSLANLESGHVEKLSMDSFDSGNYVLRVVSSEQKQDFKISKLPR